MSTDADRQARSAGRTQAPDRVFGFFTVTAGLKVLGDRLALAGHPLATAIPVAAGLWCVGHALCLFPRQWSRSIRL